MSPPARKESQSCQPTLDTRLSILETLHDERTQDHHELKQTFKEWKTEINEHLSGLRKDYEILCDQQKLEDHWKALIRNWLPLLISSLALLSSVLRDWFKSQGS